MALYNTDQTRMLEKIAIEQTGVSGRELMQIAGERAFDRIMRRYPECQNITIMCGPGNNGGDGYVVAELLQQTGASISVVRTGAPKTPDAISACQGYLDAGGVIVEESGKNLAQADLIIDGLLGAGLTRAPGNKFAEMIEAANQNPCPCVALDLPSGVSGDTGNAFVPAIQAALTVTFVGKKIGSYTGDGVANCGEVQFENLGIDPWVYQQVESPVKILAAPTTSNRKINSHKGHYGNLLIAGGDHGMLGAILLAGHAALRTGCGLVNLISRESHLDLPALYQPELMSHSFEHKEELRGILNIGNAVVIGPGTIDSQWGRSLFETAVDSPCPRVIDAGGLRILCNTDSRFEDQILTPHPGEAAVLLGIDTVKVQSDRVAAANEISERYGGVCVLKGVGTVITDRKNTLVCDRGNPGMSSAGMGDVLSGIIGAQLAKGCNPMQAACAGVWWHGVSADNQAEKLGQESLLASDVIDGLPNVIDG